MARVGAADTGSQVDSPRHGSADHRRVHAVEQPTRAAVRDQPQPHRHGTRALPLGRGHRRRATGRRARAAGVRARRGRRGARQLEHHHRRASVAARVARACKR